jgi:hypothetical protein
MGTATASTGKRFWRAALFALVMATLGVLAAFAFMHERWPLRLVDLRFVDHREKVSGGGAALNVTGYVIARVESDVDIFRQARDEDSYPVERDPDSRHFVYAVLLPARGRDGELAQTGSAVCLHFLSAGLGLPAWGASGSMTVSLPPAMREQMLAYGRRDGVVDLSLDPVCAPLLCQPD